MMGGSETVVPSSGGMVLRPLLMDHLSDLAEGQSLPVTCNGHRAELAIDTSIGWSTRLLLVFDPPHPEWGARFQTKHFELEGPGRIGWGHEGAHFQVLLRSSESN